MLRPESIKRVSDTPETRALPPAISAPPLKASKVPTLFNNNVADPPYLASQSPLRAPFAVGRPGRDVQEGIHRDRRQEQVRRRVHARRRARIDHRHVRREQRDRSVPRPRASLEERAQGDPPTGASAFEGSWIEATCDCPAATKPPFVQHKTTPGKNPSPAAPKGSCKHSCALLLWRARTLALPGDASPAPVDDDDPVPTQPAAPAAEPAPAAGAPAAVATAPPPRPAGAGGKKRRLPQSLVRAAAAAEAAAEERTAKTAKKGTAKTAKATPGGEAAAGGESGSTRKPRRADASEASGRAARVKLEPGGAGAGSAGTREPEVLEVPDPHADIIAKVKAVTDEQLLAACERIIKAEREEAAAAAARAAASVRSAPAAPAPTAASAPPAPAPSAASRPAASQAKKVDLLDDLFDFAPVPTARGGASVKPTPAPAPAPTAAATTTAVNGAGGGATGANGVNGSSSQRSGSEPASGGSGGSGPQKISLAELLGKYGMGSV